MLLLIMERYSSILRLLDRVVGIRVKITADIV